MGFTVEFEIFQFVWGWVGISGKLFNLTLPCSFPLQFSRPRGMALTAVGKTLSKRKTSEPERKKPKFFLFVFGSDSNWMCFCQKVQTGKQTQEARKKLWNTEKLERNDPNHSPQSLGHFPIMTILCSSDFTWIYPNVENAVGTAHIEFCYVGVVNLMKKIRQEADLREWCTSWTKRMYKSKPYQTLRQYQAFIGKWRKLP